MSHQEMACSSFSKDSDPAWGPTPMRHMHEDPPLMRQMVVSLLLTNINIIFGLKLD